MASQQDLKDLLQLLTTGRNKVPMMQAMQRVKALQGAKIRSISEIAASELSTLITAISDEKAAKALLAACKSHIKSTPSNKRPATSALSSTSSKRQKSAYELFNEPQTPAELEASLELPQPSTDEEAISQCSIYTNRAPLVLAFAISLLKYTMPEQPLSGRLSLAQAVCSVNSRSKAVSIGLEQGSAETDGWGTGQPKVRVMGREISVLKRSGYEWREDKNDASSSDTVRGDDNATKPDSKNEDAPRTMSHIVIEGGTSSGWTVSGKVESKKSIFVARSLDISTVSEPDSAVQKLLASNKELQGADHNITAWRVQGTRGLLEGCNDDGETGGGRHLLGLLQADNIVGVLLVVTRWYGGIMLGPDRWRIMSQVSRDALSQRLRVAGVVGEEALWGLDLEAMKKTESPVIGGLPIHRPEGARSYVLRAFASSPSTEESSKKKKSAAAVNAEKEENLGMLLGALDLLFGSWVHHIGRDALDRRAWSWYIQVRPEVAGGIAGWGSKGEVKLVDILRLRWKE